MLDVRNLAFAFEGQSPLFDAISFSQTRGEIISLLGASGCGKSTLLRLIAGLLSGAGEIKWAPEARTAFVFQDAALMPWATVEDNIMLPSSLNKSAVKGPELEFILETVEMADYADRYPKTLSGGQKMRVSIARALASKANFLLMDEPFAALDEILRFKMNDLLLSLRDRHNMAVLFVTHSLFEAAYLSDRVLVLGADGIAADLSIPQDRTLPPDQQRARPDFMASVQTISKALSK